MPTKNLLIIVLVLILAGGGFAIWQSRQEVPDETVIETPVEDPTIVGRNVSFVVTEGEAKKWKLEAGQAIYNDDQTAAKLQDVRGEFYNANGEAVMKFAAPQGDYTNQNNAVVLSGGVVAKSTDEGGGQMAAPKMTWSAKSQEIIAEGGVEMEFSGTGKSQAQKARFSMDFSFISLEGGVVSEINP